VLIEGGADRDQIAARVRRAQGLARDGLRETRRAVGALRGDGPSVPEALAALAAAHPAQLTLTGDVVGLRGDVQNTVLRVVQEALTNAAKHAPGADTTIAVDVSDLEIVVGVDTGLAGVAVGVSGLSRSGGGYGIVGMRERAQAHGGTLQAGPTEDGWRVTLRVPTAGAPAGMR
jgi:signal transduction histidine kinase